MDGLVWTGDARFVTGWYVKAGKVRRAEFGMGVVRRVMAGMEPKIQKGAKK